MPMKTRTIAAPQKAVELVLTEVRAYLRTMPKGRRPSNADLKEAWAYSIEKDWKFHFEGFSWRGAADNVYDARAKGWLAWLVEQIEQRKRGY